MFTTSLRRFGLTAAATAALAGVTVSGLMSGTAAVSASKAAGQSTAINAETVADKQVNFPQIHWNPFAGSAAYREMLNELRNLAESTANARHTGIIVNSKGNRVSVVITDNTRTNSFADVVISSSGAPTVHAIVRLSDFYVVRFYTVGSPNNFVLNLASGIPNAAGSDDNWFVGKEGYDALARVAGQSLTQVTLGENSLGSSLYELGNRGTNRTKQAQAMLRYIIGIAEAARFRPIADRIAGSMDQGSTTFITDQQVALMRSWARVSHVLVGRNNGTDPQASTSVAGAEIDDIRVAASLLATALNDGANPNPKDEL
ncbi:ribosome-inactivating family protein [Streptomyces sp. NPDC096311]|uniref:ribosome-inactivating family protein n=1 Tax=Streptomyces sp. NPDC096311 TaxID=3366083 RepID=UPI0037FE0B9F